VPTLHAQRNKNLGRAAAVAVAVVAAVLAHAAPAIAVDYADPSFGEQPLLYGLDFPVQATWAPDGRMFIAEKDGVVKVQNPGQPDATEILDISAKVNSKDDRGLLGLALDSQYPAQPFLYVVYTREIGPTPDQTGAMVSRLVRYNLGPGPDSELSNETVLLGTYASGPCPAPTNTLDCLPSDSSTHSIGTVRSAPDGTLFVGTGDGAEFNGPDDKALRSLNEQSLAGKILHVDRNGLALPGHPFCPGDSDLTHSCAKVWAQGFRNPFRFTLRDDGILVVGDVGWATHEEMDLVGGGKSYGWPCREGPAPTPDYQTFSTCQTLPPQTPPDWSWNRANDDGAIVGGPTYEGGGYPDEYDGAVFLGDYAKGTVSSVKLSGSTPAVAPFISNIAFTDLELHPSGDLVYVDPGFFTGPGTGGVYRVTFDPAGRPHAEASANPVYSDPRQPVQFSSTGSTPPNGGGPLGYEWDFGDGSPVATGANPTHSYASDGAYPVRLTVTSGAKSDTDTVVVHPGNAAPPDGLQLTATPPLYRGGQLLTLTGAANDEGTTLPASSLDWTVLLRHGGHIHPVRSWADVGEVSFTVPATHDADSHFEVILTATDAKGATTSKTFLVQPETAPLALRSVPPGAPLSYAGSVFVTPADLTAAVGFRTTLTAPDSFSSGGRNYSFSSWSDGGARQHEIEIGPGGRTLVASYADMTSVTPDPIRPKPDRTAPRLDLTARGIGVRRGVLRGTVRDGSGIRRVQVALARRDGRRCRWWQARARRPGKLAACGTPRWMTAKLTHKSAGVYEWRLALHRRLVDGRWQLVLRATDRAGNTATHLPGRGARLSLRISRGRAALR
jgi:glucose/arabinose dehydrogenase